ncbi:MAG: alpha/beta hydrolase [Pseudomonadota bacterium]
MWVEESRHTQSTDAKIYYEVYGAGPLVLIVPGLAEVPMHYFQNIPALVNAGFRVAVMSLRGHFMTAANDDACHPMLFADDILAVCANENETSVSLICESAGGWGGLRVANDRPDLVKSLLLMGSPAGAYSDENYTVVFNAIETRKARTANSDDSSGTALDGPNAARDLLCRQLAMLSASQQAPVPFPRTYLETMCDKSTWLTQEDLRNYRVPTLIVGGDNDAFLEAGFQRHVATLIPGAELSDFMDAGHEPYWEQPDRFNNVAISWLQRHYAE